MKTEFYYENIKFEFYPDTQEILINGELASGYYAPVGGVVVDMDVETPDICEVIRNIGGEKEEKTIIYDAPLSINEPVIILGEYVVSANLMVRHDLSGEFEVYKKELKKIADTQIGDIKKEAATQIGDIQEAGDNYVRILDNTVREANTAIDQKVSEAITASENAVKEVQEVVESVDSLKSEAMEAINSAKGEATQAIAADKTNAIGDIDNAKKEAIKDINQYSSKVYRPAGNVATINDLPASANEGDVYHIVDSGAEYYWSSNGKWEFMGEKVDLTDYAKKTDVPSVDGLASTIYVDGEIDKIEVVLGQLDTALDVGLGEVM